MYVFAYVAYSILFCTFYILSVYLHVLHTLKVHMHHKQDCLTLRMDSSHAKYLHGDYGEYGWYNELSVLPDRIAQYLFEFNSDSYASFHLSEFSVDRSQVDALMNKPQFLHRILLCIFYCFLHIWLSSTYMIHIVHILPKHDRRLRMCSTLLIGHKKYRAACLQLALQEQAVSKVQQ